MKREYEVVEYIGAERKVHLKTDDRHEAESEYRWLLDRKEQHDATMGIAIIELV